MCVGWLANDRLYLEPEAAFSVVQKLAESQKAPLPITQQTLWKRMHEHGLLICLPSRGNKVPRTIGDRRQPVVDISSTLILPESCTSGTSGTSGQQPQQQQGQTVCNFPAWYSEKLHTTTAKVAHSPRVPPDHHTPENQCASFPLDVVQVSSEKVAHMSDAQPQQNQWGFQGNSTKVQEVQEVQEASVYSIDSFSNDIHTHLEDTTTRKVSPSPTCPYGGPHNAIKLADGWCCSRCNSPVGAPSV
jgi:hypothetical protein